MPRVNKALAEFKGSWNRHPLSTEGNMSPLQLFMEGLNACDESSDLPEQSNSDLSVPSPTYQETELDSVQVPSNKFVPGNQLLTEIQSSVNPLCDCTDFGKGFFYTTAQLVAQHLPCTHCQLD